MNQPTRPAIVVFLVCIFLVSLLGVRVSPAQVPAGVHVEDTLPGGEACARARVAFERALLAPGASSQASANFDATYYRLDLDLDFAAPLITAAVRVEGRVVGSAMTSLALDFDDGMQVDSVTTAAGSALSYTHAADVLTVALPIQAPVGSMVAVVVHYHGLPTPGSGVFEFGTTGGVPFAWSYSEPYDARKWWPCKDHPSDKADSVTVAVTVPDNMKVGSQGLLRSTSSPAPGRLTYEWHSNYPIATYLVSVAAARYVEHDETYTRPPSLVSLYTDNLDLPLVHLVYDDGSSDLPVGWQRTAAAMEALEYWFGPYPFPAEKYGHAEVTFSGAMEHQTMTSMGSNTTNVMVHELAHQWFGDMVSPRSWRDLWLNEGFATYSELLYWEAHDSEAPGTYRALLRNTDVTALGAEGTLVLEDTTSVNNMFNPKRVYSKGGMVLHMLRGVVGDTAFRSILQQYLADPTLRFKDATTADFRRVADAVYGQSLDTFFRQWVTDGTGYPRYAVSSYLAKEGDFKAFVTVEQTQAQPESNVDVFVMPVTIAVQTRSGEERFTVMNDRRVQSFELDVTDKPISVTFDPDMALLRDTDIVSADAVLQRAPAFQRVHPNPAGTSSALRFTLPDDRPATLGVYDVAGRRVREIAVRGAGPHDMTLDLGGFTSGVYFVRIDAPAGSDTRKLVVVR